MEPATVELAVKAIGALPDLIDKILVAHTRSKELDLEMVRIKSQTNVAVSLINAQVKALEIDYKRTRETIHSNLRVVREKLREGVAASKAYEQERKLLREQISEYSKIILDRSIQMTEAERKDLVDTHKELLKYLAQLSSQSVEVIAAVNKDANQFMINVESSSPRLDLNLSQLSMRSDA